MAEFIDNLPGFRIGADSGEIAQRAQNPAATVAAFPPAAPPQPGPSLRDQIYGLKVAPGRTVGDIFASTSGVDVATGLPRAVDPVPDPSAPTTKMVKSQPFKLSDMPSMAPAAAAGNPNASSGIPMHLLLEGGKVLAARKQQTARDQLFGVVGNLGLKALANAKDPKEQASALKFLQSLAVPASLGAQAIYGDTD